MAALSPSPFLPGEKTSFSVTYFGATAGILDVEVLPPSMEKGKERQELSAKARTDSIFALFYRLRNVYRSTVDRVSGLPVRWVATLDESRQRGTTSQDFDHEKSKVSFKDHRVDEKKGPIDKEFTKDIPKGTQDVVSAIFHLRSLPLEVGKTFEIPVFIGEENCQLRAEVTAVENLSTKIGSIPAYVLKPYLMKEGQVKEIPETLIWISKESNRALLKVKAKVKVGSIIAYLRTYEAGRMIK